MTTRKIETEVQIEPGVASAEDGVVVLDGPDGVAVTMTSEAAEATGQSLIRAAQNAKQKDSGSR